MLGQYCHELHIHIHKVPRFEINSDIYPRLDRLCCEEDGDAAGAEDRITEDGHVPKQIPLCSPWTFPGFEQRSLYHLNNDGLAEEQKQHLFSLLS